MLQGILLFSIMSYILTIRQLQIQTGRMYTLENSPIGEHKGEDRGGVCCTFTSTPEFDHYVAFLRFNQFIVSYNTKEHPPLRWMPFSMKKLFLFELIQRCT